MRVDHTWIGSWTWTCCRRGSGASCRGRGSCCGYGHGRATWTWSGRVAHLGLRGPRDRLGSVRSTSLRGHGSEITARSVKKELVLKFWRFVLEARLLLTPQSLVPSSPLTASLASLLSSNSTNAKPGGFLATHTSLSGPYLVKASSMSYLLALLPRLPMYTCK